MPKKRKNDAKLQAWIDARKRHRLSHAQIQMARELGMNPRKLGGLDNHRQEPWKMPLAEYIEDLYAKRFGRDRPAVVRPIEEKRRSDAAKEARKRAAKRARRERGAAAATRGGEPAPPEESPVEPREGSRDP